MAPFDMVKKARELAGDDTDLGTADDLWGPLEPLKKAVSLVWVVLVCDFAALPIVCTCTVCGSMQTTW